MTIADDDNRSDNNGHVRTERIGGDDDVGLGATGTLAGSAQSTSSGVVSFSGFARSPIVCVVLGCLEARVSLRTIEPIIAAMTAYAAPTKQGKE
jgi:hypothetical protein